MCSVCFTGVLLGLMPGSWLCNQVDYCQAGLLSSVISKDMSPLATLLLLVKLVAGKMVSNSLEKYDTNCVNRCCLFIYLAYCV